MATTVPFPHHYAVSLDADGLLTSGRRVPIAGGAPPQFGGSLARWSPEEMLVGSVSLCLQTTFQALARRDGLDPTGFRCDADGTLDKTRDGLVFTSIRLSVELPPAADAERAGRVLELAKRHCIISNALRCPVEVEVKSIH